MPSTKLQDLRTRTSEALFGVSDWHIQHPLVLDDSYLWLDPPTSRNITFSQKMSELDGEAA